MKRNLLLLAVAISLVLSGCQKNDTQKTVESGWNVADDEADSLDTIDLTIESICEEANRERRENVECRAESSLSNVSVEDNESFLSDYVHLIELSDSDNTNRKNVQITKEEALEDIDFLNSLIRSSYGSYYLYEPEQWSEAYQNLVDYVSNKSSNELGSAELRNNILKAYSFVNDDHFKFNGKSTLEDSGGLKYYCYIKDLYFEKDQRGFFTLIEDHKWYVSGIGDDENIEEYLKPTIREDGKLVYQIGTFLVNEDKKNITVYYSRGGVTNSLDYSYTVSKSLGDQSHIPMDTQSMIYDGYYVLGIRSFKMPERPGLSKYQEMAKQLAGTDNFIIDSRGNGGGGDIYLSEFYENFTGVKLKLNLASISRFAITTSPFQKKPENRIETQDGSYAENTHLFAYLIDKNVASAGERGILSIMQMDNALLIGTNSRGCILGGGGLNYVLPNSKIVAVIGNSAFIEGNCTSEIEGLGWMPDIYVDGYLALDRTVKMYKYYGLLPDDGVSSLPIWGEKISTFE